MALMIRNYHGFVIIFFTDFKMLVIMERNLQSIHYLLKYLKDPLFFFIFFNDIHDCLRNSEAIMYADDAVGYYAASDINIIERKMNEDLKYIAQYLDDSELVISLKQKRQNLCCLVE